MLREKLGELAGGQAVCKDRLSAGNGLQNDTNFSPRLLGITSHGASAGRSILYCNGYLQNVSPLIGVGVVAHVAKTEKLFYTLEKKYTVKLLLSQARCKCYQAIVFYMGATAIF